MSIILPVISKPSPHAENERKKAYAFIQRHREKNILLQVLISGLDRNTPPKTARSVRIVTIPPFLAGMLKEYMGCIYGLTKEDPLFQISVTRIERFTDHHSEVAGVKRLTPHGLRHSHVSLLIDLGFPAHLIAERIGDSVNMINNVYGHLFENRHA